MTTACPKCRNVTRVVDSRRRDVDGLLTLRRWRECLNCGFKYTTLEIQETFLDILKETARRFVT